MLKGVVADLRKEKMVLLITEKERKWCSVQKFQKDWTGEAVIIIDDERAEEPDYRKNRRVEIVQNVGKIMNMGVLVFCILYAYAHFGFYGFLCTIFCGVGLWSCMLLIGKRGSWNIGNGIVDKLCSWRNPDGCKVKMNEENVLLKYYPLEV